MAETVTMTMEQLTTLFATFTTTNMTNMQAVLEANKSKKTERIGQVPGKFKGDRDDARRFMTGLELYFNANDELYDSEPKKLTLSFSLLEEKAGRWIQPYMDAYNTRRDIFGTLKKNKIAKREKEIKDVIDRGDEPPEEIEEEEEEFEEDEFTITKFKGFKEMFENTWYDSSQKETAQAILETIKQHDNEKVADYANRFEFQGAISGYSQEDLRTKFRRGLSSRLRNTLAGWPRKMDTLPLLKECAILAERQYDEFISNK